jgi:hypothetical protein
MGYYTDYTLNVQQGEVDLVVVMETLHRIMGPGCQAFLLDEDLKCLVSNDAMPWYDHDEDCAELSLQFPHVVFKLHGEGSDPGDLWDAYYCNGLCQICRAQFVYPPFDAARLKSVDEAQQEDEGK